MLGLWSNTPPPPAGFGEDQEEPDLAHGEVQIYLMEMYSHFCTATSTCEVADFVVKYCFAQRDGMPTGKLNMVPNFTSRNS